MYLGLDIGSTSLKAAVFDARRGRLLAQAEHRLVLDVDETGKREQDPAALLRALGAAVASLREQVADRWNDIRGIGLMIGVDFTDGDIAGEVEVEAFERGLLVLTCGDRGVRMSPPLVVNEVEMDTAIRIFCEAAAAVAARH